VKSHSSHQSPPRVRVAFINHSEKLLHCVTTQTEYCKKYAANDLRGHGRKIGSGGCRDEDIDTRGAAPRVKARQSDHIWTFGHYAYYLMRVDAVAVTL